MSTSVLVARVADLREVRRTEVEKALAFALVALTAANHSLPHHLNVATITAFALLPVWVGAVATYRGAGRVFALAGLAVVSGVLTAAGRMPLHGFDSTMAATRMLELTALVGLFGVILWARTQLPAPMVALAVGLGMLADIRMHASATAATSQDAWNLWKFELAVPFAIIGLAIAWQLGSRTLELAVPLGLAAVSAVNDARSSFAMLVLTAAVAAFMGRPRRSTNRRRRPWLAATAFLAVLATLAYKLVESAILSGWLGADAQQRTISQLRASGSLLLGGRPEAGATLALMRELPLGFGLGIPVRISDLNVAKSGMEALGYNPENGYVERYMFGGQIELHSLIGDLWAAFGIGGLLLTLYLAWVVVRSTARQVRAREARALTIHLALQALWAVFFSPVSSALVVVLFVALALEPRSRTGAAVLDVEPAEDAGEDAAPASRRPSAPRLVAQ